MIDNVLNNEFASYNAETMLYQKILDAVYDGIHITDDKGNILYVNDAFLNTIGESRHNYINHNFLDLINRRYSSDNVTSKVLKNKKAVNMLIEYYRSGKKCLVSGMPVFIDNKLVRVVAIIRDLTELNLLQEEVSRIQSLAQNYKDILREISLERNNNFDLDTRCKNMELIFNKITKISSLDTPVLLLGETGVGKDHLAKTIHNLSGKKGCFMKINCGAIPEHLIESELFGYVEGAFTGARKNGKAGMFELAENGTLYLDEIGDMPYQLQVKLLAAIQDKVIYRLGSEKCISINARIIAATNASVEDMVAHGKFRRDLYYRLNIIEITIPPLRERKEDIIHLALLFLKDFNEVYERSCHLPARALEFLVNYSWPGNIRELKNSIERAVILSEGNMLTLEAFLNGIMKQTGCSLGGDEVFIDLEEKTGLKERIEKIESFIIKQEIQRNRTLEDAAKALKIDISTLMRKKRKYS